MNLLLIAISLVNVLMKYASWLGKIINGHEYGVRKRSKAAVPVHRYFFTGAPVKFTGGPLNITGAPLYFTGTPLYLPVDC